MFHGVSRDCLVFLGENGVTENREGFRGVPGSFRVVPEMYSGGVGNVPVRFTSTGVQECPGSLRRLPESFLGILRDCRSVP